VGRKTGVVHVKVPAFVEVNTCPLVPAAVNPVPPFATATAVPLHTPLVIVPTAAKFVNEVNVVFVVAVIFSAVVAVVALVAVAAFPVILPTIGLVTVKFVKVPTLVKLEPVIVDFNVVPDNVLASIVVQVKVPLPVDVKT
jgi:hypothetical protein